MECPAYAKLRAAHLVACAQQRPRQPLGWRLLHKLPRRLLLLCKRCCLYTQLTAENLCVAHSYLQLRDSAARCFPHTHCWWYTI